MRIDKFNNLFYMHGSMTKPPEVGDILTHIMSWKKIRVTKVLSSVKSNPMVYNYIDAEPVDNIGENK